jgi:hypothetical protein
MDKAFAALTGNIRISVRIPPSLWLQYRSHHFYAFLCAIVLSKKNFHPKK